ncbi:MAG: hypothetical protein E4H13_08220 [Calditrichales bacterium]|nr:MAG: hypothetical protein E4H13_08220 [Calditrichales bacterium]
MSLIRGLVLMTRLEYLEAKYGVEKYQAFLKKISTDEINFSRQPVDGASTYPDTTLARIDQILQEDFFAGDDSAFKEIGLWSAGNFMFRFFNMYVESGQPTEFLTQYARLRKHLIGSGEMKVSIHSNNQCEIGIDYGQTIPKSVCLSEQGFIEGGMAQCGADEIQIEEHSCASIADNYICEMTIRFKRKLK